MIRNKNIIITGANGFIGKKLAEVFQSDNNLILLDKQFDDTLSQPNISHLEIDISDYDQVKTVVEKKLEERNMDPHILIHTASLRSSDFKCLMETDPVFWQKIIFTNILGTYHILRILLPYMKKNNFGKIVLFGSNVTKYGLKNGSAYAASKAAIANLTKSVSLETAKNNILINTISPGPIMMDNPAWTMEYRKFREKYYANELKFIPLKRFATATDILNLVQFLISDENSYITGEEIFLTGGKL